MKQKTCRNCKTKFTPTYSTTQVVCSPICAAKLAKEVQAKKELVKLKENIITKSDREKLLQSEINKIVRTIDFGCVCISCGNPPKKANAGHYISVGASSTLRYNLFNIWLQCEHCNTHLHSNQLNYRRSLIRMYGEEFINELEGMESKHKALKLSIEEIKELTSQAREINKSLKVDEKDTQHHTNHQRMLLRDHINQKLGIYNN